VTGVTSWTYTLKLHVIVGKFALPLY
jgi:hypothetical protein